MDQSTAGWSARSSLLLSRGWRDALVGNSDAPMDIQSYVKL